MCVQRVNWHKLRPKVLKQRFRFKLRFPFSSRGLILSRSGGKNYAPPRRWRRYGDSGGSGLGGADMVAVALISWQRWQWPRWSWHGDGYGVMMIVETIAWSRHGYFGTDRDYDCGADMTVMTVALIWQQWRHWHRQDDSGWQRRWYGQRWQWFWGVALGLWRWRRWIGGGTDTAR